jgi:hypothetical protein
MEITPMFDAAKTELVSPDTKDREDQIMLALMAMVGHMVNGHKHETVLTVLSTLLIDALAQPCKTLEEAEADLKKAQDGMAEHLRAIWPTVVASRNQPPMLPAGNA